MTASERLVAIVVGDSMDGSSGVAEIGRRLIAERSGLTLRTVHRVMDQLTAAEDGVFDVLSAGPRGRGRYRIRPSTGVTMSPVLVTR
jgi:hypothetical protein